MIPLLLVAAGAAALELKRLAKRPLGDEDTQTLLEREKYLKEILKVDTRCGINSVHIMQYMVSQDET